MLTPKRRRCKSCDENCYLKVVPGSDHPNHRIDWQNIMQGHPGSDDCQRGSKVLAVGADDEMMALGVHSSFLINHVRYWGHSMRDTVFGPNKVKLLDRCASAEAAGLV